MSTTTVRTPGPGAIKRHPRPGDYVRFISSGGIYRVESVHRWGVTLESTLPSNVHLDVARRDVEVLSARFIADWSL